jgi:hypothetical protein
MNRFATYSSLLAVLSATGLANGHSPFPIDAPTPPPCAADGTCYPNRGEWGYYPSRWRMWPGDFLEPEPSAVSPTPADARVSPELGHSETPPAELEDAAAPPSSPKREAPPELAPEATPAAPGSESGLPDVPLPDDETPPTAPVTQPTSDLDPPPALPFSVTPESRATSARRAAARGGPRLDSPRVSTNDPPPAPPWGQSAAL